MGAACLLPVRAPKADIACGTDPDLTDLAAEERSLRGWQPQVFVQLPRGTGSI